MSLRDQITSDMRDAMRAHDKEKLSALRMLLSSIKQKEVDEQITADAVSYTHLTLPTIA